MYALLPFPHPQIHHLISLFVQPIEITQRNLGESQSSGAYFLAPVSELQLPQGDGHIWVKMAWWFVSAEEGPSEVISPGPLCGMGEMGVGGGVSVCRASLPLCWKRSQFSLTGDFRTWSPVEQEYLFESQGDSICPLLEDGQMNFFFFFFNIQVPLMEEAGVAKSWRRGTQGIQSWQLLSIYPKDTGAT